MAKAEAERNRNAIISFGATGDRAAVTTAIPLQRPVLDSAPPLSPRRCRGRAGIRPDDRARRHFAPAQAF